MMMATAGPKIANDVSESANALDQLIEAASQIMREGDTIDLSLSELSLRAGLNSALVKYYFGNKNGLMLALLDRDMGNIVISLGALVAKDMPPRRKASAAYRQGHRHLLCISLSQPTADADGPRQRAGGSSTHR